MPIVKPDVNQLTWFERIFPPSGTKIQDIRINNQGIKSLQEQIKNYGEIEAKVTTWQTIARNARAAFNRKRRFCTTNMNIHQAMDFKNEFEIDFTATTQELAKTVAKHLKVVNLLTVFEQLIQVILSDSGRQFDFGRGDEGTF